MCVILFFLLLQDFKDLEIIFVNDGSTDNSLEEILKIQKNDKRIKIINKKNGGLSSARNAGLDIAKGEFILFVDSDDRLGNKNEAHGFEISKLYSAIQNCDMSVGTVNIIYESNKDMQLSDSIYYKIPWKGVKILKNNVSFPRHLRYVDGNNLRARQWRRTGRGRFRWEQNSQKEVGPMG